jgi:glycosyltransferase involved in cell wall biosynthesis
LVNRVIPAAIHTLEREASMKVLLLSDTGSEHTEKWALGLAGIGIETGLFSFNKAAYEWYHHPGITVFFEPDKNINPESTLTKISYLKYVRVLRKIIRHFKPDILHAHYASSYGLVGALSGFHPYILSVWGADVYDFPKRSGMHRRVFSHNLKKADYLLSTSEIMKKEIEGYTDKPIKVIPFGVNTEVFHPRLETNGNGTIRIGTIKPIEEKYGIRHIIEAAELLKDGDQRFEFYLIGPSRNREYYEQMLEEKKLKDRFVITGRIPFSEVQDYHNKLDIFLNVSVEESESFGVATVEAMACEKPVIVTDTGGLLEVVDNGKFGQVVRKGDSAGLAQAIRDLAADPDYRQKLGKRARQHVLECYDWNKNLEQMAALYEQVLRDKHGNKKR